MINLFPFFERPAKPEGFTGINISSFVWPELFRAVVTPIWGKTIIQQMIDKLKLFVQQEEKD